MIKNTGSKFPECTLIKLKTMLDVYSIINGEEKPVAESIRSQDLISNGNSTFIVFCCAQNNERRIFQVFQNTLRN